MDFRYAVLDCLFTVWRIWSRVQVVYTRFHADYPPYDAFDDIGAACCGSRVRAAIPPRQPSPIVPVSHDAPAPTAMMDLRDLGLRDAGDTTTLFVAPDRTCGYFGANKGQSTGAVVVCKGRLTLSQTGFLHVTGTVLAVLLLRRVAETGISHAVQTFSTASRRRHAWTGQRPSAEVIATMALMAPVRAGRLMVIRFGMLVCFNADC